MFHIVQPRMGEPASEVGCDLLQHPLPWTTCPHFSEAGLSCPGSGTQPTSPMAGLPGRALQLMAQGPPPPSLGPTPTVSLNLLGDRQEASAPIASHTVFCPLLHASAQTPTMRQLITGPGCATMSKLLPSGDVQAGAGCEADNW